MDKNKFLVFLIMLFLYLIMVFKSMIFLLPIFFIVLLKFNFINKENILYTCVVLLLFFLISYNNFYSSIQFLLIGIFYFLCLPNLVKFKNEIYEINAYLFIVLVLFLIFFGVPYSDYSVYSILTFTDRFWFEYLGNPFNPNIVGILAALSCIYFFEKGKYIPLSFVLYVFLLCQSRGAFLFLFIYFSILSMHNLKKFFSISLFLLLAIIPILYSEKLSRLNDFSLNGREDRKYYAQQLIAENFPLGYDKIQMNYFINNIGTTDNLYYHLLLKYGLFGLVFLFLMIFPILYKLKSLKSYAIIVAFLVYGLFEDSIIGNMLFLTFFGIAVFDKYSKIGIRS